ncbi:hypothetical protein ACFP3Q_00790 [Nocardioides sp. GCM10027113]|uniref:hypothetical protein n=1 Tax=unclassified Nocardioides TaxID=2615069 RepID=UPI003622372A
MGRQVPASVTSAIRTQLALVVVSGVVAVLAVVERDELLRAWAASNPNARVILEEGGLEALHDSTIALPMFAPVAVVSFFTFALLAVMLLVFFRGGHPSARWSLTGLALFVLLAMAGMVRQDPPAVFVAVAAVAAVLDVLLLWFLWHRDTSQFMRGADLAHEADDQQA